MDNLWLSADQSVYQALAQSIREYRRRPALVFNSRTVTFEEMGRNIDALALGLKRLGIKAGDKVAILLPSCPEFLYAFCAPAALGAAVVPLNPLTLASFQAVQGFGPLVVGLLIGSRIVVSETFHPGKVLELIEDEHVNLLHAPPTAILALLESREFPAMIIHPCSASL